MGQVTIEISAGSSAWRLWAPALYDIENVQVSSQKPEQSFIFAVGEEAAKVILNTQAHAQAGALTVILNGQTVWSGSSGVNERTELLAAYPEPTPKDRHSMAADGWSYLGSRQQGNVWYHGWERPVPTGPLTSLDLHDWLKPQNTLTLRAERGARLAGSVFLDTTYLKKTEHKFETYMNLSSAQYDKLPGHITFELLNVFQPGGFSVTLEQEGQVKLAEQLDAIPGGQAIPFFPVNYVAGKPAKLTIEGVDGSLFYVRNVKVWV